MQNFIKSSSSKKQTNNHNQTLTRLRNQRLRKNTALLGQPDIITVTKIKTTSSFFSKQKKTQQTSQYFINGIIFPTTAHFSTYISSKYQNAQSKSVNLSIRARLIMFDAFQQKDIHAQINIPGSLQVKVFNLSGQALKSQPQDYQRAYYSSYLRSLKPMNYPSIVLSPYIYKVDTHKQVLRKLIPFCFQNSLRQLRYEIRPIFTAQLQEQYYGNFALQIIINFITKNKFWNLVDLVIIQLDKVSQTIQLKDIKLLKHRLLFLKKQYNQILSYSSQLLSSNSSLNQWKQLQIQCLFKLKNFKIVKFLGDNLIRRGGTHQQIYQLIIMAYLQTKDYTNFLKIINTILTLHNQQEKYLNQLSHKTKRLYFMDITFTKGQNISAYPELCFEFDNDFLNRQNKLNQTKINNDQTIISQIYTLIDKVQNSLKYGSKDNQNGLSNFKTFYSLLVKFQKLKGWSQVIRYRGECFWLQTDFRSQQQSILENSQLLTSTNSLSTSINKKQQDKPFTSSFQTASLTKSQKNVSEVFQGQNQLQRQQFNQVEFIMEEQDDFDEAGLSEQSEQNEINDMPPCSKRVSNNANTARRKFFQMKKTASEENIKVLCSITLQKLFVLLYEDLRLQIQLEKWATKISMIKIIEYSQEKRQLIAILFLKKAFIHLKLQRYRKCEESLKQARKVSQSPLILLVSSYQLIHLYMRNNSMKGVQFYIVDLIKILNLYGIKKFDIVPEWAKQIITYIIEVQGIGILGKLAGPFKQLLVRWLRNNHSQNSLLKKDVTNKSQAIYKISE